MATLIAGVISAIFGGIVAIFSVNPSLGLLVGIATFLMISGFGTTLLATISPITIIVIIFIFILLKMMGGKR